MSRVAEIFPAETSQSASQSIAIIVAQTPSVVLVDAGKRDDLYAHIRREVEAFEADVSTTKGRDAIKSFAFKITRTKTAIDDAGKQLNEEARAKINVVDAARRDAREKLDALAKDVRRPLTEWEAAEDDRKLRVSDLLASVAAMANVAFEDSAADIVERMDRVTAVSFSADDFREGVDKAEERRTATLATLHAAYDRITREEADRAELARLRGEAADRDRIAAEQRAVEEAERERQEADRLAEERRVAAEKAAAQRIAEAEHAAEQRARDEAERRHAEELAAERRRAEEAEAAAQAERDRTTREEAARVAAAEHEAAEQRRREANQAHRTKVKAAAKQALITCGADEDTARKIVMAIIAGEVPHTSIAF